LNIFVTGATGVIGRRAIPLLLAAGHRVTAVARSERSARRWSEAVHPRSRWISSRPRRSSYNRTILDAERSAERFSAGVRIGVVLRFAGFYGPDARHVHHMMRFVRMGRVPIPGSPEAFLSNRKLLRRRLVTEVSECPRGWPAVLEELSEMRPSTA
jgi:nucleoside-diphosphate-sugar epimerase